MSLVSRIGLLIVLMAIPDPKADKCDRIVMAVFRILGMMMFLFGHL